MADKKKILVVDDDEDILDLLKYNLEKEDYEVKTLARSFKTIAIARSFKPDLIILDIMMPYRNGIELCRELRDERTLANTYIFFLTARTEPYFQHLAFHTGGDDYIEKVIGLKSLTKKINAVLKKDFVISKRETKLVVGNHLLLNRKNSTVLLKGNEIRLSKPEFEVLFFLAQNTCKAIDIDFLLQIIWGSEMFLTVNNISIYIQNLKQKLGTDLIRQEANNTLRLKVY
jgi:two-component system, OmpR family, alkaline phosphatase synthesis response regulator PhoP